MGEPTQDAVEKLIAILEAPKEALLKMNLGDLVELRSCLSDPDNGSIVVERLRAAYVSLQDALHQIGVFPRDGDAAEPQSVEVEVPAKNTDEPTDQKVSVGPQNTMRRVPKKAFDFMILQGVKEKKNGRPVSHNDLYELLRCFDVQTKRGSLTTKLNRMKSDHCFLNWAASDDVRLTDLGQAKLSLLQTFLTDEDVEGIRNAFNEAWGMDVPVR